MDQTSLSPESSNNLWKPPWGKEVYLLLIHFPAQICALDLCSGQHSGKSLYYSLTLVPGYCCWYKMDNSPVMGARIIPSYHSWMYLVAPTCYWCHILISCFPRVFVVVVVTKVQDATGLFQHPYMWNPEVWSTWCPMELHLTNARQLLPGKPSYHSLLGWPVHVPTWWDELFREAVPSHGFSDDIPWIAAAITQQHLPCHSNLSSLPYSPFPHFCIPYMILRVK